MLAHDPHDILSRPRSMDRREEDHEAALDAVELEIMQQMRTKQGMENLLWAWEPPEVIEALVLLANGESIKAAKVLERMVERLAREKVEQEESL